MEYLIYIIGFIIGWWILSALYKEGYINGYNRAAHDYREWIEEEKQRLELEEKNAK